MAKLKVIKRLMFKVKIIYRGEPISLWDFANLGQDGETVSYYEKVIFEEKVRKGKLVGLCEALNNCESHVG